MLDARVYRAAFVPLILAALLAAFSLERRPPPETSPLSAEAFNGSEAFGLLRELGALAPTRAPGSSGDDAVARRVERDLRRTGFTVSSRVHGGRPVGGAADLRTVVGVRPGVLSRRIVVVADRASVQPGGLAELSGTAGLLELARIFRSSEAAATGRDEAGSSRAVGRDLRRTLVLVSTSGLGLGAGRATAEAVARVAGPLESVDAVLVLGDLASTRVAKPWVVPWSTGRAQAPLGLQRTVEAAVRAEVGQGAGGARASGQWIRRAVPVTTSAQGPLVAVGLPTVELSASGERGPGPGAPVSQRRLASFGRAALRSVSAVDAVGLAAGETRGMTASIDGEGRAFAGESDGLVTVRRVLPGWAVRLFVAAALLPALVAAFDGLFRARRRRLQVGPWAVWVALGALAPLAGWLWLKVTVLVGALALPAAGVDPATVHFGTLGIVALVTAVAVAAGTWEGVRRGVAPLITPPGDPSAGGAAAAIGALLTGVVAFTWLINPYACALLVPAAHAWLFAAAPTQGRRAVRGSLAVGLGLLLPLLVGVGYASALRLGPIEVLRLALVVGGGGQLSLMGAVVLALLFACLVAVVRIGLAQAREARASPPPDAPRYRGRGLAGYAGPGSLGGTESALRR